jgi:hypothetical protein
VQVTGADEGDALLLAGRLNKPTWPTWPTRL